jgi:3-oxoadipate enol-lactonase
MDFMDVNGAALRCEMTGKGERTLVLLHEMGGTLESWDDVTPHFTGSRRVLRYDTRGAGLSEKVRGTLSVDTMAEDIAALLDTYGITGKVALAGVAVGGAIALHFAARFPDRASAVVAGSPAIGLAPDRRQAAIARVEQIEAQGMRSVVDNSMLNGYAPELRADKTRFERFRSRWLGNDAASYGTIYRMLAGMDLQEELSRLMCPALIIGGSFDRVRPPELAERVAKLIPGAQYKLLPTGHYMAVQTPDLVADSIRGFLDAVDA